MDLYTSIPMSQNVYDVYRVNVNPLQVMTGSCLPMTFYHEYVKGKPLAIGIAIIVISLVQIAVGIGSFHNSHLGPFGPFSLLSAIVFWAPLFYIITGSLMIAGKCKPSICLVNGSMVLNIINSFISFIGLILASLDMYIVTEQCHQHFQSEIRCTVFGGMATASILLVSDFLLLLIFIYSAVLGGRSMKHVPSIPQAC
ncbi:membrane-spanning 4-domains subfamily A member 12-like [Bufo bufo]|uniref:membrane-spanning 4-domains subfamily A member 12-like n=1 Tax=Bufo bufo TaxID=8384 RepID=UPI001ABE4B7A|nr:membrane-spanning 4-domains subfamily A member 12-like [Bufo bufo]